MLVSFSKLVPQSDREVGNWLARLRVLITNSAGIARRLAYGNSAQKPKGT